MTKFEHNVTGIVHKFHTNIRNGLSAEQVMKQRKKYGKNILVRERIYLPRVKIFLNQWKSPLILILVVAGVISGVVGDWTDTFVIGITVFLNVIIGFLQEDKANAALAKLRSMITYSAVVIRDGHKQKIVSEKIVVGDLIVLEAGDHIQADAQLIMAKECVVNESVLTGESVPVKKQIRPVNANVVLGNRKNMVYRGTTLINGHARAIVTAVGGSTEIGEIALLVKETTNEQTPLQTELARMSRWIAIIVVLLAVLLFGLSVWFRADTYTLFELFETSVAVAVAAIPEGLVIALTVILAVGMQTILKRHALIRKLVAAETLGSVSVICTDKTGTLTEGNMQVTRLVTFSHTFAKDTMRELSIKKEATYPDELFMIRASLLCNNALIERHDDGTEQPIGDTTEVALIHLGNDLGFDKHELDDVFPRVAELPFNSKRKFMATLHCFDGEARIYVKGAPESIIRRTSHICISGKKQKLTKQQHDWMEKQIEELTMQGLRLLAIAYKEATPDSTTIHETDVDNLIFLGFVALSDPIRKDVKHTLDVARKAGIRIIMITGDHVRTAQAIAKEIGLNGDEKYIFNGEKLHVMSDETLAEAVDNASVFARVNPKDKIRIVNALKANGEVVAMTGDGVNDAPALKGADIGVAVGSGTDVAKEIADIVLLDNNLGTIISAVEQGRTIYQNIKKVVLYLLSGSFAEVVLIGGSVIAGLPLAVLPAQILWVNLIEDTFPNIALAFDKGEKENMLQSPRKKGAPIIDTEMKVMITIISVVSNLVLFGLFIFFLETTKNLALTRTTMFVGLGIDSLLFVYAIRSMRYMVWQINPFSNWYLTGAVLFGWILLVGAVYIPILQTLLRTVPLQWHEWWILILFGFLNVFLIELVKAVFLHRVKSKQ